MSTSCGLKLIRKFSKPLKMLFVRENYCLTMIKINPSLLKSMLVGQGLGAVLLQGDISHTNVSMCNQTDGNYLLLRDYLRPVGYASKSLSEAEKHHSNIEYELLGIVWAINHFHYYIFANKNLFHF